MTVFLTVTLLLHVKRSARLRLCASLAAGMSVSEHDLGHGQAAHTKHQHTQIAHTQTHRRTNKHEEPVLQLSSHKNAAMQHLPTGQFFVLYNITTTKQTQNKVFYFSDSLLCLLRSISLFTWLTRPQQPSVFFRLSLVELEKSSKELCFVWRRRLKKSGYQCLLIVNSVGSILFTFPVSKLLC